MGNTIWKLFSPRALVFRSVCQSAEGVCLRELAYRSGLAIRSVQLAVMHLEKERLVRRKKVGNRVLFSANEKHSSAVLYRSAFEVIERIWLCERAAGDRGYAKEVLGATSDLVKFAGVIQRASKRNK